jgi:hypothetical protein
MSRGERNDPLAMGSGPCTRCDDQAAVRLTRKRADSALNFSGLADIDQDQFYSHAGAAA